MDRRAFLRCCSAGAAGLALTRLGAAEAERPNIVFILADDMGYGDAAALNAESEIPTPNLDRVAREGMTFTDAHSAAAVCTPTRYAVVTGRYPWRSRLKRGVLWGLSPHLIEPERLTVASLLKARGYHTACVGKWHLGMDFAFRDGKRKQPDYGKPIRNGPNALGFDRFFGIPASLDMPPYVYVENEHVVEPPTAKQAGRRFPAFIRSGPRAPGFHAVEVLDVLTEQATSYIGRRAKSGEPFLLYLALSCPHKPVLPVKRFRGRTALGPYGDFIVQTDWAVGQVLAALEEAGAADNTLLIFTSDNGSFMFRRDEGAADHVSKPGIQGYEPSSHRPNYVFRGTKADIYEGGHHVPFLVRWPGKVKAGSRCGATVCSVDFLATCADVVGAELPREAAEDSFSLLPLMQGREPAEPRAPVIHQSANGSLAIREGRWKLCLTNGSGGRQKPRGKRFGTPFQLFDLEADPAEAHDIAGDHPEVVARLRKRAESIMKAGRSRP